MNQPIPSGARFGRLVVLKTAGTDARRNRLYLCECDCGAESVAQGSNLKSGNTTSCGCYRRDVAQNRSHGHVSGGRRSPTYLSWMSMIARCTNPSTTGYADYGGRGITIDPRWLSFEAFLADMGERPEGRTLDRINVDGNYERSNCRWATRQEQAKNRRANRVR